MSSAAVSVRDLRKVYKIYGGSAQRLWEAISRRQLHREFHALSGISFDVPPGEGFGVVGENGAGKSTLLKILAGVTSPTSGRLAMNGKVASILELGSGFHPEFTGRQNLRLNAAMLGLSEEETELRTPDIIAFSELGSFIDQPVKTYSTGMAMRLGFSIATQVDPDVLIIDEALSVGDGYFQKKCMDRLLLFIERGGTLLFCSHAMYYVSAFCQRSLWLRNGRVEALGATNDVVREFETFLLRKSEASKTRVGNEERASVARFVGATLNALAADEGPADYEYLDPWSLELGWETDDPSLAFHVAVGIDQVNGTQICAFSTSKDGLPAFRGLSAYSVTLELPEVPLIKGEFSVYVYLLDENSLQPFDVRVLQRAFRISAASYEIGLIKVEHRWHPGDAIDVDTRLVSARAD